MRRPQRLIAAAILIAFAGVLAGCSSSLSGFDPTDLLDWLDTKKKLPGERKPVFPDGVPGLEQGVPKDLYKSNVERQEQLDQQQQNAAAVAPQQPLEPPPGSKQALKKLKGKQQAPAAGAAAPADQSAEPDGETAAASQEDAPPPPPKRKIVRKRTTAPPPDQPTQAAGQPATQSAQPFPAPLPGGTFTR